MKNLKLKNIENEIKKYCSKKINQICDFLAYFKSIDSKQVDFDIEDYLYKKYLKINSFNNKRDAIKEYEEYYAPRKLEFKEKYYNNKKLELEYKNLMQKSKAEVCPTSE